MALHSTYWEVNISLCYCLRYNNNKAQVIRTFFSLFRILEMNKVTNALVRTTTAVTMFNAGVKVQ